MQHVSENNSCNDPLEDSYSNLPYALQLKGVQLFLVTLTIIDHDTLSARNDYKILQSHCMMHTHYCYCLKSDLILMNHKDP